MAVKTMILPANMSGAEKRCVPVCLCVCGGGCVSEGIWELVERRSVAGIVSWWQETGG